MKRNLLLVLPLIALASACSSGNSAPDTTVTEPTVPVTAPTAGGAPVGAAGVLEALRAPLTGPVSVELSDGEVKMVLTEDGAGNRSFQQQNAYDGDTDIRVVDGRVYLLADAESAFAGRWASVSLEEFNGMGEALPVDAPLRDLLEDAYLSVFGYTVDECLDQNPVPTKNGENSWSIPCAADIVYTVTFDDQGRIVSGTTDGGYTATYTRDVPALTAPTDVLSGTDMDSYYAEILAAATRMSVETALEALQREASAMAAMDPTVSDSELVDAILANTAGSSAPIGRAGANMIRVSAGGSVTCSGTLTITKGAGSISKVTCGD